MDGLFEGTYTMGDLLAHGTLGIGTLGGLDGELLIIEGVPYQINVAGEVRKVTEDEKTPYAAITDFVAEDSFVVRELLSAEQLKEYLKKNFITKNTFQAVKIRGTFKEIICRSVEKQEIPYPRLPEVAEQQAEFTRKKVKGTMVGFYTPEIFGAIAVPEFHLHFLSEAEDFGGHVLTFSVEAGLAEWQNMETFEQHFPMQNKEFLEREIDYKNLAKDINKAE